MISERVTTFYLVCLTILFSMGLMLIDYGSSLKCLKECNILNIHLESLIFSKIEPRIAYHFGIVIIILTYLLLVFLICKKL